MTAAFENLCTVHSVGHGNYAWDCPPGWRQGRGAFGGLVVATLMRAMRHEHERTADVPFAVRSVTAALVGPVTAGAAEIAVTLDRAGAGLHALSARLTQGGEVKATATALFGKARGSNIRLQQLPACVPPLYAAERIVAVAPPLGPEFAQHLQYAPYGAMPFSGAQVAEAEGYVRAQIPDSVMNAEYIAAMADGYWPTLFAKLDGPAPMATIAFTLQLLRTLRDVPASAPIYMRAKTLAADAGYVVELRELYTENGELLALNEQTFVTI
jgi:acyl-CoA thioesterase